MGGVCGELMNVVHSFMNEEGERNRAGPEEG